MYTFDSNLITCNYKVNGVTVVTLSGTINVLLFNKIAFQWSIGGFSLTVNGIVVDTNTNTTMMPAETLNTLAFVDGNGLNQMIAKTKCLAVYYNLLTNSELQCLTTQY